MPPMTSSRPGARDTWKLLLQLNSSAAICASFGSWFGSLAAAIRSRVLPERYFSPAPKPPPEDEADEEAAARYEEAQAKWEAEGERLEAARALKEAQTDELQRGTKSCVFMREFDAEGKPVGAIQDGDAVVISNFRSDRVIEISKAFECVARPALRHGTALAFRARARAPHGPCAFRARGPRPRLLTQPAARAPAGTPTLRTSIGCACRKTSSLRA